MAKFRKFKITTEGGTQEVEGLAIAIEGVKCFIFSENFHWNVSHRETGMFIASHDDRKKAIERAKHAISKHTDEFERGREECKKRGFKLPINQ